MWEKFTDRAKGRKPELIEFFSSFLRGKISSVYQPENEKSSWYALPAPIPFGSRRHLRNAFLKMLSAEYFVNFAIKFDARLLELAPAAAVVPRSRPIS